MPGSAPTGIRTHPGGAKTARPVAQPEHDARHREAILHFGTVAAGVLRPNTGDEGRR